MTATKTKAPKKNKTSKKVATKLTHVAIVLDRSGSMNSIHAEAVSGLNEQLAAIRRNASKGGKTDVTLIQFDDIVDVVVDGQDPDAVKDWTNADFQPRGCTAMYDAIWSAIATLKAKDDTDNTGFLVCVISDGGENGSKEVTQQALSEEIKRLQATGKWTFAYMLANQDIHVVSQHLNVPVANMSSFVATRGGTMAASYTNSSATANYFSARGTGTLATNNFYDTTNTIDAQGE